MLLLEFGLSREKGEKRKEVKLSKIQSIQNKKRKSDFQTGLITLLASYQGVMPSDPCADGQTAPHLVDTGLIMTFVRNCGMSVDCVPSIPGKGRRHSFCNQRQITEFSFSSSARI